MPKVKTRTKTKPAVNGVDLSYIAEPLRPLAVPIADLLPDPANARLHGDKNLDGIKGSLRTFGQVKPIVVRRETMTVVCGNGTLAAAKQLGWSHLAAVVKDLDGPTAAALAISDNRTAELATWDTTALDALLRECQVSDEALKAMLADLAAANLVVDPLPAPGGGGDEFDATPEAGPTRTNMGELWVIGGVHRLLVGDCTVAENVTRLMGGEKAGLIWSDPPYGVNHSGGSKDPRAATYRSGDNIQNDALDETSLRKLVSDAYGAVPSVPGATAYAAAPPGPLLLLFAEAMRDAGYPNRGHVVWVKPAMVFGRSLYHYRHEPILYGWRADGAHYENGDRTVTSVFEVPVGEERPDHPTPKPLALLMPMIQHSSKDRDIVYDPFLGSGTTLIAAHRLNRRCYGTEIECRYADVILRRAEAEGLTCELAERRASA